MQKQSFFRKLFEIVKKSDECNVIFLPTVKTVTALIWIMLTAN